MVAVQIGYYDSAGDRSAQAALTVGGFVAPKRNWSKFSRDWQLELRSVGVRVFHMTDCMAGQGEFSGWNTEPTRRARFLRELTKIIRRHVHYAVASTVLLDDWRWLNQRYAMKECHATPYGLASFSALSKSIVWVGTNRPQDRFEPIFEEGDRDRGDREHLVGWVQDLAKGQLDGVATSENPKECLPLQAADLLAWEHRIAVRGVVAREIRELSEPLNELLRIESSYGVIKRKELDEHRARLG